MKNISILFIGITSVVYLSGCAAQLSQSQATAQTPLTQQSNLESFSGEKTEQAYERAGKYWGEMLREKGFKPEDDPDDDFVEFLVSGRRSSDILDHTKRHESYYFTVHSSLKKAFQEGFRKGYQDRKADLILGPHIEKVAGIIAERNGKYFGEDVEAYVKSQKDYLDKFTTSFDTSVAIFMELIAEGSPADRDKFKKKFMASYKLHVEKFLRERSEYLEQRRSKYISLDFSKQQHSEQDLEEKHKKDLNVTLYKSEFGILLAEEMWELLYTDSLYKVGLEMGQKLAHNLIPRPELLEWLRRTHSALNRGNIESELEIIKDGFRKGYGGTGDDVFDSMVNDI